MKYSVTNATAKRFLVPVVISANQMFTKYTRLISREIEYNICVLRYYNIHNIIQYQTILRYNYIIGILHRARKNLFQGQNFCFLENPN